MREMIGDPDIEVEIENVTTWQINQAWAHPVRPGTGSSAAATPCTGTRPPAG